MAIAPKGRMSKTEIERKRLALFFPLGYSLELLEQVGLLWREVQMFTGLATRHLAEVYFLTYGAKDANYAHEIDPVKVLPKPSAIYSGLYSFLMPLKHWQH